MCGIIGVVGTNNASEIVLAGLKKLEYRGYDSAGIALHQNNKINIIKEQGKISKLESQLNKKNLKASLAIGHTRWATHGAPSKKNAHPHSSGNIVVVHNGIIENYSEIKNTLIKAGCKFQSQTDTEVLPFLIEQNYKKDKNIISSLIKATSDLKGTYAIAVMFKDRDDVIAVAKRGSPLVIGIDDNQKFIASDFYGLAEYTNKIIALDDNEYAIISKNSINIYDKKANLVQKNFKIIETQKNKISKNGFEHFMLKEIYEQPTVLDEIMQTYIDANNNLIHLPNFNFDLTKIKKITIIACGTSYYAGMIGKYLIEKIANIEVEVDIASEFRYRHTPFRDDNLMIFVSQSGETADSIAGLKHAKNNNQKILSIVNVPHSSMAMLSDGVIRAVAGPEIGVASTKAYTAQIAILYIFAINLAFVTKNITSSQLTKYIQEFAQCANKTKKSLDNSSIGNVKKIASKLVKAKNILYIGRGISAINALESALKFRELTYINAQGIAAGELKHGTIAIIDKKFPVVVIGARNLDNELFEKTLSNAQEVNARGGKIIFISDKKGLNMIGKLAKYRLEILEIKSLIEEAILPIITTQLLAYYVAHFKGNDVDQPRNLAKSVTVE